MKSARVHVPPSIGDDIILHSKKMLHHKKRPKSAMNVATSPVRILTKSPIVGGSAVQINRKKSMRSRNTTCVPGNIHPILLLLSKKTNRSSRGSAKVVTPLKMKKKSVSIVSIETEKGNIRYAKVANNEEQPEIGNFTGHARFVSDLSIFKSNDNHIPLKSTSNSTYKFEKRQ